MRKITLETIFKEIDNRIKKEKSDIITFSNYYGEKFEIKFGIDSMAYSLELNSEKPYYDLYCSIYDKYNKSAVLKINQLDNFYYFSSICIENRIVIIFDYTTSTGQRWIKNLLNAAKSS